MEILKYIALHTSCEFLHIVDKFPTCRQKVNSGYACNCAAVLNTLEWKVAAVEDGRKLT